jgi:hypothetical protein
LVQKFWPIISGARNNYRTITDWIGTLAALFSINLERCPPINTKLPELARHILRYLREHPEAQDTVEGITIWWVSERAIKHWLPQVRSSLAALVARGYLAKRKVGDGRVFYRVNPARRLRRESSRK